MTAKLANFGLRLLLIAAVLAVWEAFVRRLRHPRLHPAARRPNVFMALYRGIVSTHVFRASAGSR